MAVEALLPVIIALMVAQLGLAIRHEARLSHLEGRLNGTLERMHDKIEHQGAQVDGLASRVRGLPCQFSDCPPEERERGD